MQETAQRMLCRLSFLALALFPTLFILLWSLWSITPWHHDRLVSAWTNRLSRDLGIVMELNHLESLAPYRYRLRQVDLLHPETKEHMAQIDSIEIDQRSRPWKIRVSKVSVELPHAATLATIFHQRCLCQPSLAYPKTICTIDDFRWTEGATELEAMKVDSILEGQSDRSSLFTRWERMSMPGIPAVQFDVARHHQAQSPTTHWQLKSGGFDIPSTLTAAFYPWTMQLGPHARFHGDVVSLENDHESRVSLSGVIEGITWNALTANLRYPMMGDEGKVSLTHAYIADGQIQQLIGEIEAEQGEIARDWLHWGREQLWLRVGNEIALNPLSMIPFSRMKFLFQLDGHGLQLRGQIPGRQPHELASMLAGREEPIAYEPESPIVPVGSLARWLLGMPVDPSGQNPVRNAAHTSIAAPSPAAPLERWLTKVLPLPNELPLASQPSTHR